MTQTLKKQDFKSVDLVSYYNKYYKAQNKIRLIVLNHLFRNVNFLTKKEKIRAITVSEYKHISREINIPEVLIHKFVSEFLIGLLRFKTFLTTNPKLISSKERDWTIRLLLYKFNRLSPVFDLKRAKENARRLKIKLDQLFFWPQILTQIAVVIFITDLLDKARPRKIIQSNLRALCCCSAYAFHRTRNKIGFTTKYIKTL